MRIGRMVTGVVLAGLCVAAFARAEDKVMPGDKGEIVGVIAQKDGGKLTVKSETAELKLIPFWRGGMPANGGGFDKDMMKRLEGFKVGDKVKIAWVFEEHYRIETIERVEDSATKAAPEVGVPLGRGRTGEP